MAKLFEGFGWKETDEEKRERQYAERRQQAAAAQTADIKKFFEFGTTQSIGRTFGSKLKDVTAATTFHLIDADVTAQGAFGSDFRSIRDAFERRQKEIASRRLFVGRPGSAV